MGGQAHQLQQLRDAPPRPLAWDVVQLGVQAQKFGCRQPIVKAEVLWQETNPRPRRGLAARLAEQPALAARGPDQPQQHLDRGGLPGAIRPQEAKHLAALNLQRQILHRDLLAKSLL